MHFDAAFSRVSIFAFTCAVAGPSIFTQQEKLYAIAADML